MLYVDWPFTMCFDHSAKSLSHNIVLDSSIYKIL